MLQVYRSSQIAQSRHQYWTRITFSRSRATAILIQGIGTQETTVLMNKEMSGTRAPARSLPEGVDGHGHHKGEVREHSCWFSTVDTWLLVSGERVTRCTPMLQAIPLTLFAFMLRAQSSSLERQKLHGQQMGVHALLPQQRQSSWALALSLRSSEVIFSLSTLFAVSFWQYLCGGRVVDSGIML